MVLNDKSTLFDDMIKTIENNEETKAVIYEMLVEGRNISYNTDAYKKGLMYGLFDQNDEKVIIHNKIFEELLYNYLLEQKNIRDMFTDFTSVDDDKFAKADRLDMEKCLLKFQELMYQEYRKELGE